MSKFESTSRPFDVNAVPVVVITGAAGSLGTATAKAFAAIGASLVLQDIPSQETKLKALVASIDHIYQSNRTSPSVKLSGTTAAYYTIIDIVKSPQALVKFTIDKFGYLSTLINNAGYLRDVSFAKQTAEQWNDIISIHLSTPRNLISAAWPYFQSQQFGRVINISSLAGICGNIGQSNYAAAKAGIHGLTLSLAKEGAKYNITVNSIAPFAQSPMTESAFPASMLDHFQPEAIAPVIIFLTTSGTPLHPSSLSSLVSSSSSSPIQQRNGKPITGELVQCGGGFVSKTVTFTPKGIVFDVQAKNSVRDKLQQIAQNWDNLDTQTARVVNNGEGNGLISNNSQLLFGHMLSSITNGSTKSFIPASSNINTDSTSPTSPQSSPPLSVPPSQTTPHHIAIAPDLNSPTPLGFDLIADRIILGLIPHLDADIVKQSGIVIGFEILPGSPVSKAPRANGTSTTPIQPPQQKRQFTIDLKNNNGGIVWNALTSTLNEKPDSILILHDSVFAKLFLREVEAQALYLTGKLKVRGDLSKAMKFEQVLKSFEHKVDVRGLVGPGQAKL